MENQALFSSEDKSKKLKYPLLQFLFGYTIFISKNYHIQMYRMNNRDLVGSFKLVKTTSHKKIIC